MPQLQKQTGSHLTLSSVPSPSIATPAPVGPLQWHQGVRPARRRLALASSFQQVTSGAPCAPHSPPRAVGLNTLRCQLLQGKFLCPTSSAAHTLPSRRAACVELLGSPVGPPSPPTPAAPTATGVTPISSCCNGHFYGKGLFPHTGTVPFSHLSPQTHSCMPGSVWMLPFLPPVSLNNKGTVLVTARPQWGPFQLLLWLVLPH